MKNIYALGEDTEIVEYSDYEVHLAVHPYEREKRVYGRTAYSCENTRLLLGPCTARPVRRRSCTAGCG